MPVTDAEAGEKWCPMVRYSPLGAGESYREATTRAEGCIGSQCMMWVWDTPPIKTYLKSEDPYAEIEPIRPNHVPQSFEWEPSEDGEPAYWVEPEAEYMARRQGHCGLVK